MEQESISSLVRLRVRRIHRHRRNLGLDATTVRFLVLCADSVLTEARPRGGEAAGHRVGHLSAPHGGMAAGRREDRPCARTPTPGGAAVGRRAGRPSGPATVTRRSNCWPPLEPPRGRPFCTDAAPRRSGCRSQQGPPSCPDAAATRKQLSGAVRVALLPGCRHEEGQLPTATRAGLLPA